VAEFVKRLFGDSLLEKAIDLAIAEEMGSEKKTFSGTPEPEPQLAEVKPDQTPPTYVAPDGINSPILTGKSEHEERDRWAWKSDSIEKRTHYVRGSDILFKIKDAIGKITDFYITSPSSDFSLQVVTDGNTLYELTYDDLATRSRSDGRLEAYQDVDDSNYVVTLSDIYFIYDAKITVFGSEITFDIVRVNYETEIKS